MNKNTIYVILALLIVLAAAIYYTKSSSNTVMNKDADSQMMASSSDDKMMENPNSTSTPSANPPTGSMPGKSSGNTTGYPASWPSDVPKYPNSNVKYNGGNNTQTTPSEATVVFSTGDSVSTVVGYYLSQLKANGWTITESGNGTANMTTFRATKAKRAVGGYAVKETNGKTTVTLGVNVGF